MSWVHPFDNALAKQVTRLPSWLKEPFTILGLATSPAIWAIILIISLLLEPTTIDRSATITILVLVPVATICKFAFKRSRPPTIYAGNMRIKSYSFPSSHSYASMLVCSFFAIGLMATGGWVFGMALIALSLIVGVSRIYLGAHYPSDVLGGWLLGAFVSLLITLWL